MGLNQEAITGYLNELLPDSQPDLLKSATDYLNHHGEIAGWIAEQSPPVQQRLSAHYITAEQPRALQQPLNREVSTKVGNNCYRLIIPSTLSADLTSKLPCSAQIDKHKANYTALKALTIAQVFGELGLNTKHRPCHKQHVWEVRPLTRTLDDLHDEIKLRFLPKLDEPTYSLPSLGLTASAKQQLHDKHNRLWLKLAKPARHFSYQSVDNGEYYCEMRLADMQLVYMPTGLVLTILSIQFNDIVHLQNTTQTEPILTRHAITLQDLVELNAAFYRTKGQLALFNTQARWQQKAAPFSWLDIMSLLLNQRNLNTNEQVNSPFAQQWQLARPLGYMQAYLQQTKQHLNTQVQELMLAQTTALQLRLAKRQSMAYLITEDELESGIGGADIRHQFSREGGCVLINPNRIGQQQRIFHQGFIANQGTQYVAVLVLAYAEYCFLQAMQNSTQMDGAIRLEQQVITTIKEQQQLLLSHRINNRFAEVSVLTMLNQVYCQWDNVFNINLYHQRLAEDIREYHELIALYHQQQSHTHNAKMEQEAKQLREQQQQHQNKIKNIATLGTALIFIASVFGTNFVEMTTLYYGEPIRFFSSDWHAVFIGLVMLTTSAFVYYSNLSINKQIARKASVTHQKQSHPKRSRLSLTLLIFGLVCVFGWGHKMWF
ncbi:hypothetical protein [Pseudoalteromonas sp. OF7H-1]|uniref:hypothetical protein n=1 Tax=Pseudoalteromonas sp. OF7H-1 TaxID=2917755 RepID=UPI001EF74257|nr:hypothetical protein [Pseudoalteromonas sp. OF7H-1]MCG7542218.1 hypothetical protein [Pseudoalteromonas sp. OF7H-1]